jgi:hypothetical protein
MPVISLIDLHRLQRAHHAGQRADHAGFGAGRHQAGWRRFGKKIAIAGLGAPSAPVSKGVNTVTEPSKRPTAA